MKIKEIINTTVVVAALGYFVDVYDLVLFLIIGKISLRDIGIEEGLIVQNFQYLLNIQMIGMLVGGIFWGILGDKKGRLSVLFGSIITYSLANIANGFVVNLDQYVILRFVAGFGLAGELGAGITLVSEIMSKENRGYGTMVVASIGVLGAVVAALVSTIGWQIAYFIGGGLGVSLLLLRVGVFESSMFNKSVNQKVKQGDFFQLFTNRHRAFKYLNCILIGLPVWFIIGILVGLSPVFAKKIGVIGDMVDATSVMMCYAGLVLGDIASGVLSNYLRSRKKVFYIFYTLCIAFVLLFLNIGAVSNTIYYGIIFCLGFSVGFWAMFVTVAAESFGTNIRATATTTVPNFVRGSLVLIVAVFNYFTKETTLGLIAGTTVVALIVFGISFVAVYCIEETFGKELDYYEKD